MAITKNHSIDTTLKKAIDKGEHIARHMIQAFEHGEITPEQAHEIGIKFAEACLGGKYEFVLTTQVDSLS